MDAPKSGSDAPPPEPYEPRLLIAEDHKISGKALGELLREDLGLVVDVVRDGESALAALRERFYSILLTDLKMPGLGGMELIQRIEAEGIPVTVIVLTGNGSIESAVEAIQHGAYDFLTKPPDPDHLRLVVRRALRDRALRDEVMRLRQQLRHREVFSHVVTRSPRMLGILDLVANLADNTTTVLIEGETGTGKELIARAIHDASHSHRGGPLVPVNCSALPENLLESELFGHEKGAFTGAVGRREGRFEQAQGGTVFLDEVGEIPMQMQVKLLRALQERTIERLGGGRPIEVDVRVIAATNRSLLSMVRKGTFREDLYYRINVIRIEVPPLRERPEDIPPLVERFAEKFATESLGPLEVSAEAMGVLLSHDWPGNVRELENVIERACVVCREPVIGVEHLPRELVKPRGGVGRNPYRADLRRPLPEQVRDVTEEFERRYLRRALRKVKGNVGRCAKLCGVSRRTVSNKIAEYDIDRDEWKKG